MVYAAINYKSNVTGQANGYYIDNVIVLTNPGDAPDNDYCIKLPTKEDFAVCSLSNKPMLCAKIDSTLTQVHMPGIGDKYDPDTGAFSRPGSDEVIWGVNTTLL
jgi:hypothetical protein